MSFHSLKDQHLPLEWTDLSFVPAVVLSCQSFSWVSCKYLAVLQLQRSTLLFAACWTACWSDSCRQKSHGSSFSLHTVDRVAASLWGKTSSSTLPLSLISAIVRKLSPLRGEWGMPTEKRCICPAGKIKILLGFSPTRLPLIEAAVDLVTSHIWIFKEAIQTFDVQILMQITQEIQVPAGTVLPHSALWIFFLSLSLSF